MFMLIRISTVAEIAEFLRKKKFLPNHMTLLLRSSEIGYCN